VSVSNDTLKSGALTCLISLCLLTVGARAFQDLHDNLQSADGATTTVWDGVYTENQAKRGETAYGGGCANCHLENLRGDNTSPSLVGTGFTSTWTTKNVRALYSRIISTMPQDNPGTLNEATVLDIVAYLFKANGFPAGANELESARAAQKIWITPKR
jgi:mono/diheme cytochrome c family protein